MGNYKWCNKDNSTAPYVVVLMVSRNKDNKDILNFTPRRIAKMCKLDMNKIHKEFQFFADNGVVGEMSRCYISLNARDPHKVQKQLIHTLIDKDEVNFNHIESLIAGIAAQKENAVEKKWFFDFDSLDQASLDKFIFDIGNIDKTIRSECIPTPHGFAVIVNHGFDTRKLLSKWDNVTLKRDDLICRFWAVKEEH